jgi:hypothetical protein
LSPRAPPCVATCRARLLIERLSHGPPHTTRPQDLASLRGSYERLEATSRAEAAEAAAALEAARSESARLRASFDAATSELTSIAASSKQREAEERAYENAALAREAALERAWEEERKALSLGHERQLAMLHDGWEAPDLDRTSPPGSPFRLLTIPGPRLSSGRRSGRGSKQS